MHHATGFTRNCWLFSAFIALAMFIAVPAHAQDIRSGINEAFHEVYDAIEAADVKTAERALKDMRRTHRDTADFHFLEGQISMLKLNDASMVRMPFIARGMRRSWERAVEIDPEHQVSLFSLAMYYAAAPGIVGGDKEKATAIHKQLAELNSSWQYPLHVTLLMGKEAEHDEVEAAFERWFEAYPELIGARMNYVLIRNNEDDRSRVYEQLKIVDTLIEANPDQVTADQRSQVDYQWGKMAAESGIALEEGKKRLLALIEEDRIPMNIREGFVHARLGAIYQQLDDQENAQSHFAKAKRLSSDDSDLKELLERLNV
ncbi:hypothetical protein FM042_07930 [Aliidiomarina halalkaliphila]|uniref:Tetratricopeptide repeat-like domain-containing protein n=1 Tax=Aliidiomarina halalkaliphila TaxID=2593535 RepID=A0A552X1I5_9GAMM|nr:hypothetical protein [Aliidiomarina halalkaliphila]TRW48902.1 hypothetical protein FM042_07930 [Aliidiomarina halalkaliphila]